MDAAMANTLSLILPGVSKHAGKYDYRVLTLNEISYLPFMVQSKVIRHSALVKDTSICEEMA
jgi:hypothetical protein